MNREELIEKVKQGMPLDRAERYEIVRDLEELQRIKQQVVSALFRNRAMGEENQK